MGFARGVKLEKRRVASFADAIQRVPASKGIPAPKMIAPLRKGASPSHILSLAKAAAIVDETDGELLSAKLEGFAEKGVRLLVACCFDEDPCTACSGAVLRERPGAVTSGLALAARACGAGETLLAADSRAEVRRMRKRCPGTRWAVAGRRYPARVLLEKKLASRGKAVALLGVQACAALSEAAEKGRSQCETVVTVSGGGVRKRGNFRVRIGTPLVRVLEAAQRDPEAAVTVIGSSVAGRRVEDLSLPVAADTRCVVSLRKAPAGKTFPCVKCDRCASVCPRGIVPWMVLKELESGRPDLLRLYHVQDCAGCAACRVVCPSGIDLRAAVEQAAVLKEGGVPHGTYGTE